MSDTSDQPTETDAALAAEPVVETWHGAPRSGSRGQDVLHPSREQLLDVVTALRAEGFLQCLDVTAVDYLTHGGRTDLPPGVEPERFEVVVLLIDHRERRRVRLRVQVPADDKGFSGVRPWAIDAALADKLWTLSERMTGVRFAF